MLVYFYFAPFRDLDASVWAGLVTSANNKICTLYLTNDYVYVYNERIRRIPMRCVICDKYFKHSAFNQSFECDACQSIVLDEIDSEMQVEVELLRHPSGKTQAVIYDDYEDTGDSV